MTNALKTIKSKQFPNCSNSSSRFSSHQRILGNLPALSCLAQLWKHPLHLLTSRVARPEQTVKGSRVEAVGARYQASPGTLQPCSSEAQLDTDGCHSWPQSEPHWALSLKFQSSILDKHLSNENSSFIFLWIRTTLPHVQCPFMRPSIFLETKLSEK